jgi:cyanophycinase
MTKPREPSPKKIALLGGDEFTPECKAVDAPLIATLKRKRPNIAIVPTATGHINPQMAVNKAISYFALLGATAYGIAIHNKSDANDVSLTNELSHADAIYLPGGDPLYLLHSIENSLFLSVLSDILSSGRLIIGSSAGAMVLCESMQVPPGKGSTVPGVNLIPNLCILPHYENLSHSLVFDTDYKKPGSLIERSTALLGIDSRTALFIDGKDYKVLGSGYVTVIDDKNPRKYSNGSSLDNLF